MINNLCIRSRNINSQCDDILFS